jgi:serine/threonine protein kinase
MEEDAPIVGRILTKEEIKAFRKQLAQNPTGRARMGSTSLFPSIEELSSLREKKNCNTKFGKTYKLNQKLSEGGASGGTVFSVTTVGEKQRTKRLTKRKLPLVLKVTELTGESTDEENFTDVVIGSRINLPVVAQIAPGFMQTVDWFVCHDFVIDHSQAKSMFYVLFERQDMTMYKYLSGVSVVEPQLVKSLFAQLLYTLESAQHSLEFVHGDLHTENVMVKAARDKEMSKVDYWRYKRVDGRTMWISAHDSNKHVVAMIDFGRSRMRFPKITHFGKLKDDVSEILGIEGFEHLGILDNEFNSYYDIRRISMSFVDQMIDETYQRPLSAPHRPGSRKKDRTVDFFQALKRQSHAEYEAFMNVLDEMSGHRFVHTQQSLGVGATGQTTRDLHLAKQWEGYYHKLSTMMNDERQLVYPNMTLDEVNGVLDQFRDGGMRWLVRSLRAGQFDHIVFIEQMWMWTAFEFPGRPDDVLNMPFFESLYAKPKSRKATSAVVGEYREIFDRGGTIEQELNIELQCNACKMVSAKQECPCREVVYCSDDCADAHWEKHSLVCEV